MNNLPIYDEINRNVFDKRNKGAFYTPAECAEISAGMVRNAINNRPEGNDYIIIDRCSGVGNLERFFTDEELKHCILNTVQESEHKKLQEIYEGKVLAILPPSDALSREFIDDAFIKKYLEDPSYTIILLENPPYSTSNSIENQKEGNGKAAGKNRKNYVIEEMKNNKVPSNDIVNAFIWSAFKYYLRQPTDSYIVYAPIKYWKKDHLVHKEYEEAYLFNRKRFNAPHYAAISCIRWNNKDSDLKEITFKCIDKDERFETSTKRIYTSIVKEAYPKLNLDNCEKGVYVSYDGYPKELNATVDPLWHKDIIGYLVCNSSEFNNPRLHTCLLSAPLAYGGGFYLTRDNFVDYLPLYCVGNFGNIHDEWYYTAFVMKSGDKAKEFFEDVDDGILNDFLYDCLIYTCLSRQNHCTTFVGEDGRTYNNELTFDKQFGDTAATLAQEWYIKNNDLKGNFIKKEKRLELLYSFDELKKMYREIKPNVNYNIGFYEICNELEKDNKDIKTKTDYIKKKNKEYFDEYIFPVLKKYEFIK